MYKISKEPNGVVLTCHDCAHVESIDAFNESLGSRRTQAARAMQAHARATHGAGAAHECGIRSDKTLTMPG